MSLARQAYTYGSLSDLSILPKAYGTTSGTSKLTANADINNYGKVGLSDLSLLAKHYGARALAKAYGSKPGDPNWNPLADIAPPYGIIGLTELVTLAVHYGQHYP